MTMKKLLSLVLFLPILLSAQTTIINQNGSIYVNVSGTPFTLSKSRLQVLNNDPNIVFVTGNNGPQLTIPYVNVITPASSNIGDLWGKLQGYISNYKDTAVASVTNISTGYGITGGPITGSGTIKADTTKMATQYYVKNNSGSNIGPKFYATTNTELAYSTPTISAAYGYRPRIVYSLALPGLVKAGWSVQISAQGQCTNPYSGYNIQMSEGINITGQNKGGITITPPPSYFEGAYINWPSGVNIVPANHHFQWAQTAQYVFPSNINNGNINVYVYSAASSASLGDTMIVDGGLSDGQPYGHLSYILDTTTSLISSTIPTIANTMNYEVNQWLGTLSTQPKQYYINALNTFISGLKTDGNWQLIDRIWIFADTTQQAALTSIDLSNSVAKNIASATFTANQGFSFNGSSNYISTPFQDSVSSNFLYNSGTLIIYDRTSSTSTYLNVGSYGAAANNENYFNDYYTGSAYYSICSNNGLVTASNSNSLGLYQVSRTATNLTTLYKNGSSLGSTTTAAVASSTYRWYVGAVNAAGTAASFGTNQCAILVIGGGKINASAFNTRFQTFKTAIGF